MQRQRDPEFNDRGTLRNRCVAFVPDNVCSKGKANGPQGSKKRGSMNLVVTVTISKHKLDLPARNRVVVGEGDDHVTTRSLATVTTPSLDDLART